MYNVLHLNINLQALIYNYRFMQAKVAPYLCGAVVKANAYGLGMEQVATALSHENCPFMFVASLDEAMSLRSLLPEMPIVILNGIRTGEEEYCVQYHLIPALHNAEGIIAWNLYGKGQNKKLPAFFQLDTGLGRLGLSEEEVLLLASTSLSYIEVLYIMTHFACPELPDNPHNALQLTRFKTMQALWSKEYHTIPTSLANSAGAFLNERLSWRTY